MHDRPLGPRGPEPRVLCRSQPGVTGPNFAKQKLARIWANKNLAGIWADFLLPGIWAEFLWAGILAEILLSGIWNDNVWL